MELLLAEAFKIAVEVHGNQRDKAGEPYMGHICRVMSQMDTDQERCVAILHDVLEDGERGDARTRMCFRIDSTYGTEIIKSVLALSRIPGEPYMDYIRRLSRNPLAVKVKLVDIRDNMRRDRMRKLPALEAERLYQRYHEAYCFLTGKQWEHEDAAEDAERYAAFKPRWAANVTVHPPIELVIDPTAPTISESIQNIFTEEEISIEEAKERFKL